MIIDNVKFTFGCDPELFIGRTQDKKVYFVGADGLIPGSKEEPYKVKNGAIQVDGMAAELNIDPVDNEEDFVGNISSVIKDIKDRLPKGYGLFSSPTAEFSKEEWEKQPDHAKILGCNPDFNAYTGKANPSPDANHTFRSGAGHIHVGWGVDFDKNDPELHAAARFLAILMDYYVGGPLSRVANDYKRMELYGRPGCYRTTSFGFEYRSPSNFWLSSEELVRAVFQATVKALSNRSEKIVQNMMISSYQQSFYYYDNKSPIFEKA